MPIINFIPFLLVILLLLVPPVLFYAKRAIVRGDWSGHRNRMVIALALWGVAMLLLAVHLLRDGVDGLLLEGNLMEVVYFIIALACSFLIIVTLLKVVKHQYLPHKLLARKTILVWGTISMLGAVFFLSSIMVIAFL